MNCNDENNNIFDFSRWEDEDYCITMNGKPIGQSGFKRAEAKYFASWLNAAWDEIEKYFISHI